MPPNRLRAEVSMPKSHRVEDLAEIAVSAVPLCVSFIGIPITALQPSTHLDLPENPDRHRILSDRILVSAGIPGVDLSVTERILERNWTDRILEMEMVLGLERNFRSH